MAKVERGRWGESDEGGRGSKSREVKEANGSEER